MHELILVLDFSKRLEFLHSDSDSAFEATHKATVICFVSNPLSRRHIKLPSIRTLPISESKLSYGLGCVKEVIISCSPTEQGCRALMKFGSRNELAFCCPGLSTEWTPIEKCYKSYVYSSRQKLFFCVKDDVYYSFSLDALDLGDPQSPRLIPMGVSFDSDNYPVAAESDNNVKYLCDFEKGLVINEQSDELFVVNRSIMSRMDGDGNYVEDVYYGPERGYDNSYPYKTIAFDVHKYDPETGSLRYMDRSLDGLAFFTGLNDGFALSAADFPGLKPDSIYFTDVYSPPGLWPDDMTYGGHDLGIFNYQDASFSPCYYACDVRSIKRIDPAPVWFTPNPL